MNRLLTVAIVSHSTACVPTVKRRSRRGAIRLAAHSLRLTAGTDPISPLILSPSGGEEKGRPAERVFASLRATGCGGGAVPKRRLTSSPGLRPPSPRVERDGVRTRHAEERFELGSQPSLVAASADVAGLVPEPDAGAADSVRPVRPGSERPIAQGMVISALIPALTLRTSPATRTRPDAVPVLARGRPSSRASSTGQSA